MDLYRKNSTCCSYLYSDCIANHLLPKRLLNGRRKGFLLKSEGGHPETSLEGREKKKGGILLDQGSSSCSSLKTCSGKQG